MYDRESFSTFDKPLHSVRAFNLRLKNRREPGGSNATNATLLEWRVELVLERCAATYAWRRLAPSGPAPPARFTTSAKIEKDFRTRFAFAFKNEKESSLSLSLSSLSEEFAVWPIYGVSRD